MEKRYIISLLSAAINNTEPLLPPADIDWKKIYTISVNNSIAGTISPAIMKLPKEYQPDKSIISMFSRNEMIAVGLDSMQEYELSSVMNTFEENHIIHAPLKGWFMKKLYPLSHMRTMCDVDILVKKADVPVIAEVLVQHGFVFKSHENNHDGYIKANKISVEIHWDLFPDKMPYHDYFTDIADKLIDIDGKVYMKQLSNEDYYLHLIAHLAKHFKRSGSGLRSLADIWLYNKEYRETFDMDYIKHELTKLQLDDFESTIYKTVTQLFSGAEWDDTTLLITDYVIFSGTYGNNKNYITVSISEKGSKTSYIISRIFLKKSIMKKKYPIIEKYPVLLPAYWLIRIVQGIFNKSTDIHKELTMLKNINSDKLYENTNIKKICGLK